MGKYIMRSHQLVIGDVVTESGLSIAGPEGHPERNVVITEVRYGEIWYQNELVPVHFITGKDARTHSTVKWAKNAWHRWLVERNGAGRVPVSV